MDQPCEIKCQLLAKVVLDKVEWLHIFKVANCNHPDKETPSVVFPSHLDLFPILSVQWKVGFNYARLDKVVEVELPF